MGKQYNKDCEHEEKKKNVVGKRENEMKKGKNCLAKSGLNGFQNRILFDSML